MRIVILGGSGSATPELADALADWPGGVTRRPALDVVLSSRSADRLKVVAAEMRRRVDGLDGPRIEILTETDLEAALTGADVVLNAVRVGGLAARVFDESFSQRHGIPGEETMGPGGFANALRTVPVVRALWTSVARVAPSALHINLTNPSGVVTAAVERDTGLRIFSVCDSPTTFADAIAGRLGVPAVEVRRRYVGMNHVGWWVPNDWQELEATLDLANGQEPEAVRAHAALGAAYVRYYVQPAPILESQLAASETRAQQLQRLETELLEGYARGASDLPHRGAIWYGRAVLPLVDAWMHGSDEPLTVGMRNDGRIAGLPDDAITEGPVLISKPGLVDPIEAPELPSLPASLLAQHAAFEAMTVAATSETATRIDRVRALMANPMVGSYDIASAMLDDIEAGSPS